ncbi:MAG: twin-arginine translocase TatA/TatE family subunit [bacterium]
MAIGPWQILIIVVLVLVLFGGKGKISSIMGDFAQGLKAFRKGLSEEEQAIADEKDKEDNKPAASMKETEKDDANA